MCGIINVCMENAEGADSKDFIDLEKVNTHVAAVYLNKGNESANRFQESVH